MKKFITSISQQVKDLQLTSYLPVDGEIRKLGEQRKKERGAENFFATSFPILCLIDDYVKKGEDIEIICMKDDFDSVRKNFETFFKDQLGKLSDEIGFTYKLREIEVEKEEVPAAHIRTFKSLIRSVKDEDEIYICCTYGTKPTPIIEMMAMNYAYRVFKNVSMKIVYGAIDWSNSPDPKNPVSKLYDITELFRIDQMVNHFAETGGDDSGDKIEKLLSIYGDLS